MNKRIYNKTQSETLPKADRGGQPAHVWTKQRRKRQAESAKHAWSKMTPFLRVYHNARRELERHPIADEPYIDMEIDFEAAFIEGHLNKILNWPPYRFKALAKRAGVKDEDLTAFRAKYILEHADFGEAEHAEYESTQR